MCHMRSTPGMNQIRHENLQLTCSTAQECAICIKMFVFSSVLPEGCGNFTGPFGAECLDNVWEEQGCITSGDGYPSSLPDHDFNFLREMNLK